MILFASDEEIRAEQQRVARLKKGETISAETARREMLDDARELRSHARIREFSYLLFVLPVLIGLVSAAATYLVSLVLK